MFKTLKTEQKWYSTGATTKRVLCFSYRDRPSRTLRTPKTGLAKRQATAWPAGCSARGTGARLFQKRHAKRKNKASSSFPGTGMKELRLRSSPPGESQELSVRLRSLIRRRATTVLGIHATARPSVVRRRDDQQGVKFPGNFGRAEGGEKEQDQRPREARGRRELTTQSKRGHRSEKDVALARKSALDRSARLRRAHMPLSHLAGESCLQVRELAPPLPPDGPAPEPAEGRRGHSALMKARRGVVDAAVRRRPQGEAAAPFRAVELLQWPSRKEGRPPAKKPPQPSCRSLETGLPDPRSNFADAT